MSIGRDFMSLEENKAIVRRLIEAENERNYALFDEVMAPDFAVSDTPTRGREIYKQSCKTFIKAFPDFHGTIEDAIAEGDRVWIRAKYTGTHKGEHFGIAPTGKKVTMTAVAIYRIVDAKVAEMWKRIGMDFFKGIGTIEYTEKGKKLFPEDSR
jgi:predicted ester cyclase